MSAATNQTVGYSSQGNYSAVRPHVQFPQTYSQGGNSHSQQTNNQYQSARPSNITQYPPYPVRIYFEVIDSFIY